MPANLGSYKPALWEHQVGESARAYQAFIAYRDQPPLTRSITEVARKLGRAPKTVWNVSTEHRWRERVSAWDAERDKVSCQARLDAIREAQARHVGVAVAMIDKVVQALDERTRNPGYNVLKLRDSPHALAEWAATAVKIERDALGVVPPERTASGQPTPENAKAQRDREVDEMLSDLPPGLVWKTQELVVEIQQHEAEKRARARGLGPNAQTATSPA